MANNLLQILQEKLAHSSLGEVNAGKWQEAFAKSELSEDLSNEAVLPAVLTALCKYSRTAKGAEAILLANLSTDWVTFIFGIRKMEIIETIAEYSHYTTTDILIKVTAVTEEAIRAIRKQVTVNGSIKDIRNALEDSLDNALFHLPIHMQIDELLNGNIPGNAIAGPKDLAYRTINHMGKPMANVGSNQNSPVGQIN